ncbi:hypothetical protein O6H91_05G128300 [Diphasiastrum complanatum]|uniref:Uncharacterized protein n=2 Tax=Diphasiastrum complanatum TaxID=34168 RepID=A0ACC2DTL1_DIPCM|nr:hypothetical protein O6H91_05G128300 [Diphasiastrum complanatum]KAJ7557483.1 hypothetical protein O6H91_05G128300 [Diphasiastrum complanatum]
MRGSQKRKRQYFGRVRLDGVEFKVGDDVYLKRIDAGKEESDEEVEDCVVCRRAGGGTMIECDICLGGFHLKCLDPPLKAVPAGDWACLYCEEGEGRNKRKRPTRRSIKRHRTARERLLASELWAARIDRLWKEPDSSYWFEGPWYIIPEETAMGRQPHNGRREVFRTNHIDTNEMESILRHCYVMEPGAFQKASNEGDDVFFCEYEYDAQWHTFRRIANIDQNDLALSNDGNSEGDWSGDNTEEHEVKSSTYRKHKKQKKVIKEVPIRRKKYSIAAKHANSHSRIGGLEGLWAKSIPSDVRRSQTEFEKAKHALLLSSIPGSLPCRETERKEIRSFLDDAVAAGTQCLGRCLYISGVPGTGKTATVLEVLRGLHKRVEDGELQPYRFIEINGLRLISPEHTYTMIHEALTGEHIGWKKALQKLDKRFSQIVSSSSVDGRPCILLVDELDLLVTRNQSVLYNIFDWPTRAHSRLIVIGIANTIDLPERLLPRIASRMGLQRISFSPYTHHQLQEIIHSRLCGIQAFDKLSVEFASRKVAAVSGDARRALELCRRAVELAEQRLSDLSSTTIKGCRHAKGLGASGKLIGMADVEAAILEMFQAPHMQIMKQSSKQAKIFLLAILHEQNRTGMAETSFEKVAIAHSLLCSTNNEQCPNWDTLLAIGCRLGACRLLLSEQGSQHRLQKLQLNFPSEDVSFALKDNKEVPWLAKYLC